MIILNGNEAQNTRPLALTIGFFDGVHLGHRDLLRQVQESAAAQGLQTAVITFPESPRKVLGGGTKPVRLLTPLEEKRDALADTDIHYCIELSFTRELSQLCAQDFMQKYLKERYNTQLLMIGYDHHFGHDTNSGFDHYAAIGKALGIEVQKAQRYFTPEGICVSSTLIRGFLDQGDVETAGLCLGRPYNLSGTVIRGQQLGRKLGFPTANMRPDSAEKLIPQNGVYAVQVRVGEEKYGGMLNIGMRPTLEESHSEKSIEAHLFNFEGNLYGRHLDIDFIYRMRDEHKFTSLDALKRQLTIDASRARQFFEHK